MIITRNEKDKILKLQMTVSIGDRLYVADKWFVVLRVFDDKSVLATSDDSKQEYILVLKDDKWAIKNQADFLSDEAFKPMKTPSTEALNRVQNILSGSSNGESVGLTNANANMTFNQYDLDANRPSLTFQDYSKLQMSIEMVIPST